MGWIERKLPDGRVVIFQEQLYNWAIRIASSVEARYSDDIW